MGRMWKGRPWWAPMIASIALAAVLSGGAYAAITGIPDSRRVFHACINAQTGALRVVKSSAQCHRGGTVRIGHRRIRVAGEHAIAWNQQGPQGRQGSQGLQGVQGVKGDKGDPGPGASAFAVGPSHGTDAQLFADANLTLTAHCVNVGTSTLVITNNTAGTEFVHLSGINSLANGGSPTPVAFLDSILVGTSDPIGIATAAFAGPIIIKTGSKVYDVELNWDDTIGQCFVTGTVIPG
jgi:hypothetical protein